MDDPAQELINKQAPVIELGYTFGTVTDKISSIVLTRPYSNGWVVIFGSCHVLRGCVSCSRSRIPRILSRVSGSCDLFPSVLLCACAPKIALLRLFTPCWPGDGAAPRGIWLPTNWLISCSLAWRRR